MFENIKDKFPIYKKSPELVFLDTAASALKPKSVVNVIKFINYQILHEIN